MAERRMFAKTIIDSDAFLDMPLSAQALYFHLSMRADDDGFVNNPKRIQKVIGSNDDDYNVLIMKRFILTFDSGIIVIKHWKIHNYIRQDRKKDTAYPNEMALLEEKDNGAYTFRTDLLSITDNEELEVRESDSDNRSTDLRKKAYEESSLPYSFDYKIRQAFWGEPCPICGVLMGTEREDGIPLSGLKPTIQHNVPISKGGKHELGNISVICHKCNVSLKDTETSSLNADKVIEIWDRLTNDGQMSDKCLTSDSVNKLTLPNIPKPNNPISSSKSKSEHKDNIISLLDESELDIEVKEKVREWVTYKSERKEGYKPQGFKSLLSQISNKVQEIGIRRVCHSIDVSMASNWAGIHYDTDRDNKSKTGSPADIVDSWI